MSLFLKSPKFILAIPNKIFASLLFFSVTVAPNLLLVVSTSSNSPFISSSEFVPMALASISLKIFAKSVFKFGLSGAFLTTFSNN